MSDSLVYSQEESLYNDISAGDDSYRSSQHSGVQALSWTEVKQGNGLQVHEVQIQNVPKEQVSCSTYEKFFVEIFKAGRIIARDVCCEEQEAKIQGEKLLNEFLEKSEGDDFEVKYYAETHLDVFKEYSLHHTSKEPDLDAAKAKGERILKQILEPKPTPELVHEWLKINAYACEYETLGIQANIVKPQKEKDFMVVFTSESERWGSPQRTGFFPTLREAKEFSEAFVEHLKAREERTLFCVEKDCPYCTLQDL